MKKSNENGSQVVIAIVILLVIAVVSFVGWRVLSKDKTTDNSSTQNSTLTAETHENSAKNELAKVYKNTSRKFSVNYPEDWTEKTTENNELEGLPEVDTELKSPGGGVVRLKADGGGFGGSCDNDESNPCPIKEYLFKEAIKETTYHEEKRDGSTKTPIYLTRSKTSSDDGKVLYGVGLETDADNKIELNTPERGLLLSYPFFSFIDKAGEFKGVIYAYTYCDTPDNFATSSDCGVAELILRSFSFYE